MAASLTADLRKHRNAVIAGGLAVVLFLYLRARQSAAGLSQMPQAQSDVPAATDGSLSGLSGAADNTSGDTTALAAALEGIQSGLADQQTSLAQLDADVQSTTEAVLQAAQLQNDASSLGGPASPISGGGPSYPTNPFSGRPYVPSVVTGYDAFGYPYVAGQPINPGPVEVAGFSEGTSSFTITPAVIAAAMGARRASQPAPAPASVSAPIATIKTAMASPAPTPIKVAAVVDAATPARGGTRVAV
jgi:hypothetical protein